MLSSATLAATDTFTLERQPRHDARRRDDHRRRNYRRGQRQDADPRRRHRQQRRGTGNLTKAGLGTLKLTAHETFTGATVVNTGTLELAAADDGSSVLRSSSLTVNAGATVLSTTSNTFGWWGTRIATLNINGGTVDNSSFGQHFWNTTVNMTGGSILIGSNNSQWGGDGVLPAPQVNVLSSGTMATISGAGYVRLREGMSDLTFTVADGSQPVDLQVTNMQNAGATNGFIKAGDGAMELVGSLDNSGLRGVANGGTLLLSKASTATVMTVGAGGGTTA